MYPSSLAPRYASRAGINPHPCSKGSAPFALLSKPHKPHRGHLACRYRVQYSDGDKEDLALEELRTQLLPSFQALVTDKQLLLPDPYV